MKRVYLLLLCLSSILIMQTRNWEYIFNGKNLRGWKKLNGKVEYKVMDGAIVRILKLDTPNTFLVTQKQYDDFILEFDLKIDEGLSSGVRLRSESRKDYQKGRVYDYRFEIGPSEHAWLGGIYDEACRNWLYPLTWSPRARTASRSKEWNRARVETFGNSIIT